MEISLRKAEKNDIPEILSLIRELAAFERAADEVSISPDELEKDGFGEHPLFEVILAETNKGIAGMAFYFISYSTWKGKCIYLEDIIVKKQLRGKGIGAMLFEAVVRKARQIQARRMQWQVLEWNEEAIRFYKKYNACLDPEWINGKLTREQIMNFGN